MNRAPRKRIRHAAAPGNRRGSRRSARATIVKRAMHVGIARGDRDGQSEPFLWYGKEGWSRPRQRRTVWHFWRHGHTVCGAYTWRRDWPHPVLEEKAPGVRCRKCERRSTLHRGRRLWRDYAREGSR